MIPYFVIVATVLAMGLVAQLLAWTRPEIQEEVES